MKRILELIILFTFLLISCSSNEEQQIENVDYYEYFIQNSEFVNSILTIQKSGNNQEILSPEIITSNEVKIICDIFNDVTPKNNPEEHSIALHDFIKAINDISQPDKLEQRWDWNCSYDYGDYYFNGYLHNTPDCETMPSCCEQLYCEELVCQVNVFHEATQDNPLSQFDAIGNAIIGQILQAIARIMGTQWPAAGTPQGFGVATAIAALVGLLRMIGDAVWFTAEFEACTWKKHLFYESWNAPCAESNPGCECPIEPTCDLFTDESYGGYEIPVECY